MATFFNQATLTYSGGTVNSNITTGDIIEVLSASKTAITDEYGVNDVLTYAVNIINSGDTPITGLTVTDNLGAYTFNGQTLRPLNFVDGSVRYFSNGVLSPTPTVTAGPPLVITGITVPANGNATLIYSARTNEFAPPIGTGIIENTAVISGNSVSNISVTETVGARIGPDLSITKSLSPETVVENGQITYTFTVINNGNEAATAEDAIVITDNFDPTLSDITVTYNGDVWTTPANYTYNEATGLFSTVAGQITVPAASFAQDPVTGEWQITPGTATLTVTGTV